MIRNISEIDWMDLEPGTVVFYKRFQKTRFDKKCFFLQNVHPDLKHFDSLIKNPNNHDLDYATSLEYEEDFTIDANQIYDFYEFEINVSQDKQLTYMVLDMFLKLPYGYKEDEAVFEEDLTGGKPENKFEDGFIVNRMSQDFMNVVINSINRVSKDTIMYPKRCNVICFNPRVIDRKAAKLKDFEAETLFISRNFCFETNGKSEEKLQRIKKFVDFGLQKMFQIKLIFLQMMNEIGAFQFRKELGLVNFLKKQDYFQFVDKKTVEELEKDDVEEMDRDIRESWVDMALENMVSFIKENV